MAAGITGTSALDQTVNAIRAKAIFTMQDQGVFPGVVDRVSVPDGNRSFTEPKIAALTAYELTEGVDMDQAQQLTDTLLTVSPVEYGVQVIYTRLAQRTRSESTAALISRAITDALKKKQDTVGTVMMDGFETTLGSGTGTATRGYLGAAMALIRGNATEPSNEPVSCVLHPYCYNDLVDQIADMGIPAGSTIASFTAPFNVGVGGLPEEFARKYVVGRVANMPIVTDANIALTSNTAKGAAFTKRALVYAELWGIDVQPQKDESLRGTEMNGTMCFAYGERTDLSGTELYLAATAPSS